MESALMVMASALTATSPALTAKDTTTAPAFSSPLSFLLGTPAGPEIARGLADSDRSAVTGPLDLRPADLLFGNQPAEDSQGRLSWLLNQDQKDLFGERVFSESSVPQGRDLADLLPMQERILALVATLFGPRERTPDETEAARAANDPDREGRNPERVVGAERSVEATLTPPSQEKAVLNFAAGVDSFGTPEAPPGSDAAPAGDGAGAQEGGTGPE
jgi:hypothetical protein